MNADMSDWGAGMHGRRTQPSRLEEFWEVEFELEGEEEEEEDKSWWCVWFFVHVPPGLSIAYTSIGPYGPSFRGEGARDQR